MPQRKKLTKIEDGQKYVKYEGDDFWMEAK